MTDIVERLRRMAQDVMPGNLCDQAADEIERLRRLDKDWQSAASEAATTAQGVIDELRKERDDFERKWLNALKVPEVLELKQEIERLRQQLAETKEELASCIEDLDREVRVGNDYMSQLAECERERDAVAQQLAYSEQGKRKASNELATVTAERDELVAVLPDLSFVIAWLANGCNVQDAIAELKLYQAALAKAERREAGQVGANKTGEM